MPRFDNVVETAGPCGALCGCCGCLGGTAAGIVTWIYLIWPAMGANDALKGLGQYLITLLGPGEAYVGAWLVAGTISLALVGCCVGAVVGLGPHNDLTPEDLELGLDSKTTVIRLKNISQELTAAFTVAARI